MNIFTAILLGIVQGVAEFLPISSSGHLGLLHNIFGLENVEQSNMTFDVLLHLGTLVAVFIVYRRDIWEMIKEFFKLFGEATNQRREGEKRVISMSPKRRLLIMVVIATVPLVAASLVSDYVEQLQQSTIAIGIALLITGVILFTADRCRKGKKTEKDASFWDALIVGLAQAVGVVPGISRSGITISAGLFSGFDREFAVRFSFLLSIPAVLGANILTLAKGGLDISAGMLPAYIAGIVTAAVCGYFAIKLVKYLVDSKKFGGFAYYCWVVGLAAIAYELIFVL